MTTNDRVRPQEDLAFFEAVRAVFEKYPEAKAKYAIASLSLETELGIDFDRQVGVSRVEDGGRIITEFVDRDGGGAPGGRVTVSGHATCVKHDFNGRCIGFKDLPQ